MIRVGVIGHAGRMGSEVCRTVEADPELDLVARIGPSDDLSALQENAAEVAVDFTTADVVVDNVRWCVDHGIHAVVGTTGISEDDLSGIGKLVAERGANVLIAPNFALGAVLMMSFAAQAARFYDHCEIVERHHDRKVDAPSGTALRTAALVSETHGRDWPARTSNELLTGSRGGDAHGVRIHSLRAPGSVAHQEVVFGGTGETLTLRHDSLDRSSFMPGVVLAIRRIGSTPGLTVGLEHLLELDR